MTEPFVPPDLDLRDFDYMPLLVETLPKSDIVIKATAEEFRAAVLLWCACWHEVPSSSLPDDDSLLARAAGYGFNIKGWMKVKKGAMRNFELCDDGRFYHPVIADLAIKARKKKRDDSDRTKNATDARRRRNEQRERQLDDERGCQRDDAVNDQRNVHQGKLREVEGTASAVQRAREPELAFQAWNTLAEQTGLPKAQILTQPRRSSLAKRLTECGGLEGWNAALDKVRCSHFLNGGGDRGWKVDLDFVLQASSFAKLMEGSYDDRKANGNGIDQRFREAANILDKRRQTASSDDSGAPDRELLSERKA